MKLTNWKKERNEKFPPAWDKDMSRPKENIACTICSGTTSCSIEGKIRGYDYLVLTSDEKGRRVVKIYSIAQYDNFPYRRDDKQRVIDQGYHYCYHFKDIPIQLRKVFTNEEKLKTGKYLLN